MFGNIVDGKMKLNEYGKIAKKEWLKTSKLRKNVKLDIYQIMPNHIHGIIIIVGAGLSRPQSGSSRPTLGQIVAYFKYQSTKQINDIINGSENPTPTGEYVIKKTFQRNYYEHVIRNEQSLNEIREYIKNNPKNWETDRNNPKNV